MESYRIANEIAHKCLDTQVINVADREADIIELWEAAVKSLSQGNAAHLVIRGNHKRTIIPTLENPNNKLFEFGKAAPIVSHCEFELKNRSTHSVIRKVRQTIRASSVNIYPAYRSGVDRQQVLLNVVVMEEIDPPAGMESIQWYLLTTLPIKNNEDVHKIVEVYLSRWDIEILFRTFKTGCKVEERSLRTAERLYPMFALFLIVAWRINSLSKISRVNPDLPCTVIFSEKEWQAAYTALHKKHPPANAPTVREMLIIVARLGGYLNRNSDPEPGEKVIWRGLEHLRVFMEALEIIQSLNNTQD